MKDLLDYGCVLMFVHMIMIILLCWLITRNNRLSLKLVIVDKLLNTSLMSLFVFSVLSYTSF